MFGVIRRECAGFQHQVVARTFLLDVKSRNGDESQRIEPVHSPRELRQNLHEAVMAFDVRQLV
jgi:hypothetical protein